MSLSITKSLIKSPITFNALSALNRVVIPKRDFSHTLTNQFFFNKKQKKVEVENLNNSTWKMGVPQKIPKGNISKYQPEEIKDMIGFFLGTLPSSSSLISTISPDGVANAAPFALCNCICRDPPIISLTVSRKPDGSLKDTQVNIDATNEFGVNVVSEWFLESSCAAAAPFPPNVSEFEKVGFTKMPSTVIKVPLVAQSAVSYECKVISRTQFKDKNGAETSVVYNGEVVKIHVNDEIYDNKTGEFNYDNFKLITSLKKDKYAKVFSIINTASPSKP